MNKELINENSIITSDMQKLYFLVAKQTNYFNFVENSW